jgi:HAD superfamily hydrolase (TIGR01490 family)
LRTLQIASSENFKNVVLSELRGWPREAVARLGRQLYERELRPFLRPAGIQELNKLRASGFTPVVVSGAFDFFIHPFCAEHGIDSYFCTHVAFAEETCLGRLEGPEMRGEIKCQALRGHFAAGQVDWEGSCAFSDEISDLPLFDLVGHAYLVNGSAPMRTGQDHIQPVVW